MQSAKRAPVLVRALLIVRGSRFLSSRQFCEGSPTYAPFRPFSPPPPGHFDRWDPDDCLFSYISVSLGGVYAILMVWGFVYLMRLCCVPKRVAQKSFLSLTFTQATLRVAFFFLWPSGVFDTACSPLTLTNQNVVLDMLVGGAFNINQLPALICFV